MRTHCRAERLLTLPRFRDPAEILARRRLIAVAGLLALAAQLLFAPSILILAAAFGLTGRLTRWHPLWLAVPAAAGLLTVLAAGPSRAIAAFAAGSARVAGYFTADAGEPERLLHPLDAYRDARAWLAGQVPLALILAAAEAAALWAIWRLRAGTPLASRPGLVVAARARASAAAIRSGAVVSRTGVRLGVDPATGRPAEVSWREAEGGVLCAGCGPAAAVGSAGPAGAVGSAGPAGATGAAVLAEIGFRFVHAAIRLGQAARPWRDASPQPAGRADPRCPGSQAGQLRRSTCGGWRPSGRRHCSPSSAVATSLRPRGPPDLWWPASSRSARSSRTCRCALTCSSGSADATCSTPGCSLT